MRSCKRGPWLRLAPAGLGAAIACGPIRTLGGSSASGNACPEAPCGSYVQANDVLCIGGICLIDPAQGPPTSDLVAVVSVPEDAYLAPGRTFAMPYDSLATGVGARSTSTQTGPAELPSVATVAGLYAVTPRLAQTVNWDLGTAGNTTALPFHATFRLLWPDGSSVGPEADLLGLPVLPVQADSVQSLGFLQGPGGGPETEFQTYLQPGTYERTMTPDPPFDQAFGPVTQVVTLSSGSSVDQGTIESYDTTGGQNLPTFSITRSAGTLDGWTAYLRDAQNNRIVSSRAPLSGTTTSNVILAVKRSADPSQPDPDALSGTDLVVAPPASALQPTGVFNLFNTLTPILYPTLPAPVTVEGRVTGPTGSPVPAVLVFEAVSITALSTPDQMPYQNTMNFEFALPVNTTMNPSTGDSTYSATLPSGVYRIDVRPDSPATDEPIATPDAGTAGSAALLVASSSLLQAQELDFALPPRQPARGVARVADGRTLSGAAVDAIPLRCMDSSVSAMTTTSPSPWCLPRATQTTTLADGSFSLGLDPGYFTLRVRPADGTRLPWFIVPQSIVADGTDSISLAPVFVPAPMSVGLAIADPAGNPIAGALIRIFRLPAAAPGGPATELGEAVTGTDGVFDLYVAPPSP
jgi:hypothetical protein